MFLTALQQLSCLGPRVLHGAAQVGALPRDTPWLLETSVLRPGYAMTWRDRSVISYAAHPKLRAMHPHYDPKSAAQ